MRPSVGIRVRILFGVMAGAGVGLAHVIAFRLAAPHEAERQELLQSTGHGWWPVALALSLAALVAGLVHVVLRRSGSEHRSPPFRQFVLAVCRLVPFQVVGFALLEGAERLVSGNGLVHLLQEPVFLLGLLLQVVVAVAAAVVLVVVTRAVRTLLSLIRGSVRAPRGARMRPTLPEVPPRTRVLAGGATLRAPPLAA